MNEIESRQWAQTLRTLRASESEDSCDRFLELIQAAEGGGFAEAAALLSTITDQPEDAGQGEAVLSFLPFSTGCSTQGDRGRDSSTGRGWTA